MVHSSSPFRPEKKSFPFKVSDSEEQDTCTKKTEETAALREETWMSLYQCGKVKTRLS